MGGSLRRGPTLFAFLLFSPILCSSRNPKTDAPACRARTDFVKRLTPPHFDPKQNCADLNYILQAVNKDNKYDFCSADREHVLGYIREAFRPALGGTKKMPHDCEIEQWWFEGHYPRSPVAFCKNATAIAATRDKQIRFNLTRAQPFFNVVHAPRSLCHNLLRQDLETIGNPDVAGPGVMASYLTQLLLCAFFSVFHRHHRHRGLGLRRRAERSFAAFYTTTMIMALSIAVASAVVFAEKRAAPSSIRSDLRFPNIYEYRLLTLAPAFAVLPVLVAHTLYCERRLRQPEREPQSLRKRSWPVPLGRLHHHSRRRRIKVPVLTRVLTSLVCFLCIVVVWVIWVVGEQGRKSPVRFDFGHGMNIRVSGFLYTQAGDYTLAVACLTTIFPLLGMFSLRIPGRARVGLWFRVACLLLALVEWIMLMFIRTKAVEDGQGHTSETEIGFGQILALFTWVPVSFILTFGVEFPGVDDVKI
ncbi:hypothetical protein PG985_014721 [Apiospora marii]|uniref:Integral membrane protein n=1 Tax=Apiospora marii TaxID=335849 RepID=A0ABR1R4A6_9PEZI